MNIGLLSILHNKVWDFRQDMAQTYANALKNAIELQLENDIEKQHGYFLSKKGYKEKDGRTVGANFEDKLYVGNINRIENHLCYNDEELADDDQIINVVVIDGPITRDGGGCSYGSKDWRDQVMYANTIPQVVGHLFIVNTPGGEAESRNDYDMMIADCREKGKPTVSLIDGGCYSSGVNLTCRTDRVIVMNPKDGYGCIGTMAAFWAVAHDTVDQDGYRYVELVGKDCPEKNAWWREAAKGEYKKLQAELDKDTEEFHNTVRENRPLVTDDMLSGKIFEAQEVIPALVDEIGDMERAIECVFALAEEKMQAARFAVANSDGNGGGDTDSVEEPEEIAKLNAQQKAAIKKERGNLTVVDDGHVKVEREGLFGPHMKEIATPNNENDMTDEEKKAQEAAAAQAEENQDAQEQEQQAQAQEQQNQEHTSEDQQQEQQAQEQAQEKNDQQAQEQQQEQQAQEQEDSQEKTTLEEAQAEMDRISETLHTAEQTIAERDSKIEELSQKIVELTNDSEGQKATAEQLQADLDGARADIEKANSTIAERDKTISEKDALIEQLKKQNSELQAEVKELAENPGHMVNEDAGIPKGNGTGDKPKEMGAVKPVITADMSPSEIRAALKAQDQAIQARRMRS